MKTRGFVVVMFAVALSFAPQFVNTSSAASGGYSAQLISPTAGQVLYPGQKVKVEWRSTLPNIEVQFCEMEIFLSLDGGNTCLTCITPILDPRTQFFYWTVPNMPTNAAVLDIRFGCERCTPNAIALRLHRLL